MSNTILKKEANLIKKEAGKEVAAARTVVQKEKAAVNKVLKRPALKK